MPFEAQVYCVNANDFEGAIKVRTEDAVSRLSAKVTAASGTLKYCG
jgi:hypothetical protein